MFRMRQFAHPIQELSMKFLTSRVVNLGAFVICCLLLVGAYFLEYALHVQPCPLCILQRVWFFLLALTFLFAGLHRPQKIGLFVYGVLVVLFALLGLLTAGRQVWLQTHPMAAPQLCLPGFSYLITTLNFSAAFQSLFSGSGSCEQKGWSLWGFSLADWTFLFFCVFVIIGLLQIISYFRNLSKHS